MSDPAYLEAQANKKHKTNRAKIQKRKYVKTEAQKKKKQQKKENQEIKKLFKVATKPEKRLINLKKTIDDFVEKFPGGLGEFLQVFEMLDQGSTVDLADLDSNDARVILEHFLGLLDVPSFGSSFKKKPGDSDSLKDFVKQISELGYGQLRTMLPGGGDDEEDEEEDPSENDDQESKEGGDQAQDQPPEIPAQNPSPSNPTHPPKPGEKSKAVTWEQVIQISKEDRNQILKEVPKDDVFERIKASKKTPSAPKTVSGSQVKTAEASQPSTPPPPPVPLHTLVVQNPSTVLGKTHPSISRYTGI